MYFVRTKFQFYTNNESLKTLHKTETTTILVTLVGSVGMFCALPKLVCASWHHRSKKFNTGRERAQRLVAIWFMYREPQLNLMRIVVTYPNEFSNLNTRSVLNTFISNEIYGFFTCQKTNYKKLLSLYFKTEKEKKLCPIALQNRSVLHLDKVSV